jgi:hypothetical protein
MHLDSIHLVGGETTEPSSGLGFHFRPRASYQYVFSRTGPAETLGRLDIRWRTAEGDTGHLQTAPLSHGPLGHDKEPITLALKPKKQLLVNEPGEIQVSLTNNTPRQLVDVFFGVKLGHPNPSIVPIGEPFVHINLLEPATTKVITLAIIPVREGVIDVENLILGFTDEWVKQRLPKSTNLHIEAA